MKNYGIIGTPAKVDINNLIKCPNNRQSLFVFYKRNGATSDYFEIVVRYIEKGKYVYYFDKYFAFYDECGNLIAGEGPDWGD